MSAPGAEIYTVGHSTHPAERFVRLLRSAGIEAIADVRRYPGSRRNPQFGAAALAATLAEAGIAYEQLGERLGGRRSRRRGEGAPDNSALRNASFRAYADHMSSEEFAAGLERLEELGRDRRTAVMCAEAHSSRCHRRLIADSLLARGWAVIHLLADGRREPHRLAPEAVVENGRVTYPAGGAAGAGSQLGLIR